MFHRLRSSPLSLPSSQRGVTPRPSATCCGEMFSPPCQVKCFFSTAFPPALTSCGETTLVYWLQLSRVSGSMLVFWPFCGDARASRGTSAHNSHFFPGSDRCALLCDCAGVSRGTSVYRQTPCRWRTRPRESSPARAQPFFSMASRPPPTSSLRTRTMPGGCLE